MPIPPSYTSPRPTNTFESAVLRAPQGDAVEIIRGEVDIPTYRVPTNGGFNDTTVPLVVGGTSRLIFVENRQTSRIKVVGTNPADVGTEVAALSSQLVAIDSIGEATGVESAVPRATIVVHRVTSDQAAIDTGDDLIFNGIQYQGPTNTEFLYDQLTGIWTLTRGRTYRLRCVPSFDEFTAPASGTVVFQWVQSDDAELSPGAGKGIVFAQGNTIDAAQSLSREAHLIYTPVANTLVKIRAINVVGGPVDMPQGSTSGGFASVEEI